MSSGIRRNTIDHPNQFHVLPGRSVFNPLVFQGNPMVGCSQGSVSMGPSYVEVQAQVQAPIIPMRPYSYFTNYQRGARYPSMVTDLEILSTVVNSQLKNLNMTPIVGVLAQRSPFELEILKHQFRVMTGGMDLYMVFKSLVINEDDCIKSVCAGLTLGLIGFDLWLLDGVLFFLSAGL